MKQRINKYYARFKKSDDSKALVSNFAYLTILQVAGYIFPIITIPYLSRVIGAEGYGRIAFSAAIIVWVNTVVDWGFSYTSTREVARHRDDKEYVSQVYFTTLWAKVMLMVITFLILIVCIIFVPTLRENLTVLIFTFLMIPGQMLFADWFFQAMERMKYITYFNLFIKIIFTASVFLFIKQKSDYIYYPLIMSIGYLITGVAAAYLVLYKWQYRLYAPNIKQIGRAIHDSKDIFINTIAPNLYNSFGTVLLGLYSTPKANGILDAGRKFPGLTNTFLGILTRVFYPFLVRKEDKHKYFVIIMMLLSCIAVVTLWLLGPWLLDVFYTSDFKGAYTVLRLQIISVIFLSLSSVFGTNYLLVINKDKIVRNVTLISSIIGFVVAFPLIANYGYIGASLTYIIASVCLGCGMTYFGINEKRKRNKK